MQLDYNIKKNIEWIQDQLPCENSYDIIMWNMKIGDRDAVLIAINGLCNMELLQRIFSNVIGGNDTFSWERLEDFVACKISYAQCNLVQEGEEMLLQVLSGPVALLVDGFAQAVILDVREYPERDNAEPDTEQVIKGAGDGFVEMITSNASMIRRRIRSKKLTFEMHQVGTESKTDVMIAYMKGNAEEDLLASLRTKLQSIQASALTSGSRSLEELLLKKKWFHPLPVIQSTQRPDTACSYLLEGYVLVLVDNSPMAMILPCSIFQFTQSAEDYYKSPLVGTYFRMLRFFCILLSLYLLPAFLLISNSFPGLSAQINLIATESVSDVKLFLLVLIMEFALDLFRYSAAHAASRYATPMSIIGGLIAGDVAISLNWATAETIFYAAITLLATLALPSIEFGEGLRIYRMFLILMTGFGGLFGYGFLGFCIASGLILLSVFTTPTFGNKSYMWPLFPLNWKALKNVLFRYPTFQAQPSKNWFTKSQKLSNMENRSN